MFGDKCLGMLEAMEEVLTEAKYQRYTVRFYRNVFSFNVSLPDEAGGKDA